MKSLETKRTDLFAKVHAFQRAKDLQAAGFYPYFCDVHKPGMAGVVRVR